MYGSLLSGGLAGHVYGAEGIWSADIESASPVKMWDAFQWHSGFEMQHLRTFALSIGRKIQELEPDANLVSPNKTHITLGYEGWAYAARTPDKKIFLAYFEKACKRSQIRAALPLSSYRGSGLIPGSGLGVTQGTAMWSRLPQASSNFPISRTSRLGAAPRIYSLSRVTSAA